MNIIKLNAIDSTNSYLKKLVRETSVADRTVVVAKQQLKGRGQMGNGWHSEMGKSLTFSMFKRFENLLPENQFMISMVVSIAIADVLKGLHIPNLAIKWPNDILSGNKKIGGILIENVLEGSFIKYAVIGIGINVNESSFPNLPQASSLKLQTGITFQGDEVLDSLLQGIYENLENLGAQEFSTIKFEYEKRLYKKDKISVFENYDGNLFNGIIRGISDAGELFVEPEKGPIQKFDLKQLRMIY